MSITSLQVCMESSSDWLQGPTSEENASLMDHSTLITTHPGGPHEEPDILLCGGPPADRRLRPHHDLALKCPRCESTHTKFCYYNNYSLSQPRYFCKACRRYWTKGGTLRNIPVGGGCRKNKKLSSNPKKTAPSPPPSITPPAASLLNPAGLHPSPPPLILDHHDNTELRLAFPEQLSFSAAHNPGLFNPINPGLFFEDVCQDSMGYMGVTKYDGFMGMQQNPSSSSFNGFRTNSPVFGMSSSQSGIDNQGGVLNILESYQRLMLPNDDNNYPLNKNNNNNVEMINHHYDSKHEVDEKPNTRVLSVDWHDCNLDAGIKDTFGYNIGGVGSWAGLMNGYGPSAMNPLV